MYLQDILQPHTGGEGGDGLGDQTAPHTPHNAPFLSTELLTTHSTTPLRLTKGAADVDQPTIDCAEEGVEAGFDTNADVEATSLGSSRVTSTGSIVTTFLVNNEIIPIKIENISGDYRLFNLIFIICF